jgi:hypothetical protein
MAHEFEDPLETLADPRRLQDVSKLMGGLLDRHKVTHDFFYEGVLLLEVVSEEKTLRKGNYKKTRRILILGNAVDGGEMVAFQILTSKAGKKSSWTSWGTDFNDKKTNKYPEVVWCKGLAMLHTGHGFGRENVEKHRVKMVTELMRYADDMTVAWKSLDFGAIKVSHSIGRIGGRGH